MLLRLMLVLVGFGVFLGSWSMDEASALPLCKRENPPPVCTGDIDKPKPPKPPVPNRIRTPSSVEGRCHSPEAADPYFCQIMREDGLKAGCINQVEHSSLTQFGSFPICDGNKLISWCICGCFRSDVRLLSLNTKNKLQWQKAQSLYENQSLKLLGLTPNSSLSDVKFRPYPIAYATKGPESKALYVIETEYGDRLALTSAHPVLLDTGRMVTANQLEIGQHLVNVRGESVVIKNIKRESYTGDVFNFSVATKDTTSHIIAAEGVLVGDLNWQSSYDEEQKAIAIRQ